MSKFFEMKSALISLILIFSALNVFSQATDFEWKGKVVSTEGMGVPYAFIQINSSDRNFIFETDAIGEVDIRYIGQLEKDSIHITHIAHLTRSFAITELQQKDTIQLKPKINLIDEITIVPPKSISYSLGNKKNFALFAVQIGFNAKKALYIPTNENSGKIEKIRVYMHNGGDKDWKYRPFSLELYAARLSDQGDLSIDENLLSKETIASLNPKKGNWVEINLKHLKIDLPHPGILVAIKAMSADYYKKNGFIKNEIIDGNRLNSINIGYTNNKRNNNVSFSYNSEEIGWGQSTYENKYKYLIQVIVNEVIE